MVTDTWTVLIQCPLIDRAFICCHKLSPKLTAFMFDLKMQFSCIFGDSIIAIFSLNNSTHYNFNLWLLSRVLCEIAVLAYDHDDDMSKFFSAAKIEPNKRIIIQ